MRRAVTVAVTALIEGHAPESRADQDVGNRRPYSTTLTARVQQQDGRPDSPLLAVEDHVGPREAPCLRNNHAGTPPSPCDVKVTG
nr:hypothetical protein [Kibdelosporangium sp. MJ126-NF4]